ncbi:MAG: hypothetical protein ACOCSE_06315 [Chitinivibrionales bacterium]
MNTWREWFIGVSFTLALLLCSPGQDEAQERGRGSEETGLRPDSGVADPGNDLSEGEGNTLSDFLSIEGIRCESAGEDRVTFLVSVNLYYEGGQKEGEQSIKGEILLKRNELKVIMNEIIREKRITDTGRDEIEREFMKQANSILDQGRIEKVDIYRIAIKE